MTTINDFILSKARYSLSDFMIRKASKLSKELGFSYIESETAPNTYEELVKAYEHSKKTLAPLPVFSGASEDTIYTSKEANWAFRFWHDLIHVKGGYQFNLIDEAQCSYIQCKDIAKHFGKTSVEYQLFVADTIGQSLYAEIHGGLFPTNQLNYVKSLLEVR